jgi:hypothetical protein
MPIAKEELFESLTETLAHRDGPPVDIEAELAKPASERSEGFHRLVSESIFRELVENSRRLAKQGR